MSKNVRNRNIFCRSTLLVVSLYVLIGVFGIFLNADAADQGHVNSCDIIVHSGDMCPLSTTTDNVNHWEDKFVAMLQSNLLTLLTVAFGVTSLLWLGSQLRLARLHRSKFYKGRDPDIQTFKNLFKALKKGIIHSKVY